MSPTRLGQSGRTPDLQAPVEHGTGVPTNAQDDPAAEIEAADRCSRPTADARPGSASTTPDRPVVAGMRGRGPSLSTCLPAPGSGVTRPSEPADRQLTWRDERRGDQAFVVDWQSPVEAGR